MINLLAVIYTISCQTSAYAIGKKVNTGESAHQKRCSSRQFLFKRVCLNLYILLYEPRDS